MLNIHVCRYCVDFHNEIYIIIIVSKTSFSTDSSFFCQLTLIKKFKRKKGEIIQKYYNDRRKKTLQYKKTNFGENT